MPEWTEEQLRLMMREEIRRTPTVPELPRLEDSEVDDLLRYEGNGWVPYTMPFARVWRDADTTIGPGAPVAIVFNQERFDTEELPPGMWEVPNPTRLTCKQAGVYLFVAHAVWTPSAPTTPIMEIRHMDVKAATTILVRSPEDKNMLCATIYPMKLNEYVELYIGHGSLANVDIDSQTDYSPSLMAARIP